MPRECDTSTVVLRRGAAELRDLAVRLLPRAVREPARLRRDDSGDAGQPPGPATTHGRSNPLWSKWVIHGVSRRACSTFSRQPVEAAIKLARWTFFSNHHNPLPRPNSPLARPPAGSSMIVGQYCGLRPFSIFMSSNCEPRPMSCAATAPGPPSIASTNHDAR
jgi:hypothetical protein